MLADPERGQLFRKQIFNIAVNERGGGGWGGGWQMKFKIRTCSNVKTKINKSSFQDSLTNFLLYVLTLSIKIFEF